MRRAGNTKVGTYHVGQPAGAVANLHFSSNRKTVVEMSKQTPTQLVCDPLTSIDFWSFPPCPLRSCRRSSCCLDAPQINSCLGCWTGPPEDRPLLNGNVPSRGERAMQTDPAVTFSVWYTNHNSTECFYLKKKKENQLRGFNHQWRNAGHQLLDFGLFLSALSVLDISSWVKAWNS